MKLSDVSFVFLLTAMNPWFISRFEVSGAKAPICEQPIVHRGTKKHTIKRGGGSKSYVWQIKSDSGGFEFCKILCRNGHWRGPVCQTEIGDIKDNMFEVGCTLPFIPSYLEVRQKHELIKQKSKELLEFPIGSELISRCSNQNQAMLGLSKMKCIDGKWDHSLPFCYNTSTRAHFDESLPPSIQFQVTEGSFVLGRGGELVVSPGSSIILDCVFMRSRGTPEWSWTISNNTKDYITGWMTSGPEDEQWLYRLELVNVSFEESGNYNCTTQRGYANTKTVIVTDTVCGLVPYQDGIVKNNLDDGQDAFPVGSTARYYCPAGYTLHGDSDIFCREDGTWSGEGTHCLPIQCPPLEITSSHLRVISLNNSFTGLASFDCPFGFRLTGKKNIECKEDGRWSGLVPDCEAIICPPPAPPTSGSLALGDDNSGGHYVGSSVQWSCDPGHVMVGEPVTTCTHLGIWSHATPACMLACRYPGSPLHGVISPVKFVYNVGESVMVLCDQGYTAMSTTTLLCTDQGQWTHNIPVCVDVLE